MNERIAALALIAVAVVILGTAAVIKVNVWGECRVNNSFFYCLSLIGK